jgi:general secretion pathway protein A
VYEKFFSLEETPFVLTPDPRMLFRGKAHHEILAALVYGVTSQKGLMALIGDVGTGKTTLGRALLRELPEDVHSALVLNPHLSGAELMGAILDDLGVERKGSTKGELMTTLGEYLLTAGEKGETVLVVVDEAQQMSVEALEQIRILSNLETPTRKLLQIVLAGQPELESMLKRHELRQLDQRIGIRCRLRPLDRRDTCRYVEHRLRAAGLNGRLPFTPDALALIYRHSRGIPRVINLVCDRALMAAYSAQAREVPASLVRSAIRNLDGQGSRRNVAWPAVVAASVVAALAVGGAGATVFRARSTATPAQTPPAQTPAPTATTEAAAVTPTPPAPASPFRAAPPVVVDAAAGVSASVLAPERQRSIAFLVVRLLTLWGVKDDLTEVMAARALAGPDGALDLPAVAERYQLTATFLPATTLAELRAIALPALVELAEPTGRRYVLVTRVHGDRVVVTDTVGRDTVRSGSELAQAWTRTAWIVWRNVDQLPINPAGEMTPTVIATLALRLHKLGYLEEPLPASTEDRFRSAVREFQQVVGLPADGRVGPRTTLALARVLGGKFNPTIATP